MSYIPSNPYYAWVYLKIGLFEATPIPPEHLISMELQRGPGSGTQFKTVNAGKDAGKDANGNIVVSEEQPDGDTDLFSSGRIVLFDETALRVEAQVILGRKIVQLCYGYVNGPRSEVINLAINTYATSFSRTGSATLTLNVVSTAALALRLPGYFTYKDKTLNEIVESVREANNWGGGIEAGTVEPIKDRTETVWEKDESDPNKYNEVTKPKTFLRLNQNPIEFLQYEIAPYCVSEDGNYGNYRLWFDDPAAPENGSISGKSSSDIANAVSDFFKGFLTNLTDPLMKEINKALGDVLGWVAVSLSQVQELIGSLGGFISDAMSKLTGALGSLQSVAKQAISALASGGLSGMTQSLTSSLMTAGMNMIKGAVGGMLDKVTSGLTSQIGSLAGGNLGGMLGGLLSGGGLSGITEGLIGSLMNNLAGGLGSALTKLNNLTNISMINLDSLNKLKNSSKFARMLEKGLSMSGSVMYFKPILIDPEKDGKGIGLSYFFEVGTTGGKDGESSVLDFSYSDAGKGINIENNVNGARDVLLSGFSIGDGGFLLEGGSVEDLVEARNQDGAQDLQAGRVILAVSSNTPQGLEALSASLLSLYRQQTCLKATLKIFGDPNMRAFKKCQVTVMTKTGQIHYSSGYYLITKVVDNIQGGAYTTTLELIKHPDDRTEFEPASIQGGAIGNVFEEMAIDNSEDAQINESRRDVDTNVTDRQEEISLEWEEDIWGNKTLGTEDLDNYTKEGE